MVVREHIPLKQGLRQNTLFPDQILVIRVREHIPLKQGLRLFEFCVDCVQTMVREHIPLKQGLRLFWPFPKLFLILVREHIPLKQGLRHSLILISWFCAVVVREHIPLKQGLRLYLNLTSTPLRWGQRAYYGYHEEVLRYP